jgi:hypothetical protein
MISDKAKAAILDKCCQKVDCLARGEVIDLEGALDASQTSPETGGRLGLIQRLERVRLALREDKWMNGAEVITDAIAEISRSAGHAQRPAQSIDELAAEITEEIRCEQRARERVAKAEEISGDIYLLKVLLSVIDSQSAALREYEAAVSPDTSTDREGK